MAGEKKGGGKAGALLKTMGRGSPRTRAPEGESPESPGTEAAGILEVASEPVAGAGPRRRERPAKPVRITVDLDAGRHRFLRDFAHREDARGTEVIRALLDELGSDEDLVERVRDRLAGGGS